MRTLGIVSLCVGCAIAYGILHDQVTARICVEYFTIGHPRILPPGLPAKDPTLLGVAWGILASWWVGLGLGIPLAIAALAGRRPPRSIRSLLRPIGTLLAVMAGSAALAGVIGYLAARAGLVELVEPLAELVPLPRHDRFLADLWAHSASYAVGFLGGLVLIMRVWRSRRLGVMPPGSV